MESIELNAQKREITGKKVKQLRAKNLIPAVLYGSNSKPENITVNKKEFEKIYSKAGSSALVDLKIDDKPATKVLIHEPQMDPVSDLPLHIDFYKIDMTKKITTEIPLKFIGESLAVKELEGNLITNKDSIEVECLPKDLVHEIEVDISIIKNFETLIHISDLKIPETINILDNQGETVAQVTPPRSEEELEAMEQEAVSDQEKAGIEKIETAAEAEKAAKEAEKVDNEEGSEKTAAPTKEKVNEPTKNENKK